MKSVHYLSIQGRCAPSFWFKNHDAQNFRSLVESITLHSALVVSSIYRSDVFYFSNQDMSELIIRMWCALKGHKYDDQMKCKFIRADNKPDAFEFFFDTIFHLMRHPLHHDRYKQRLSEIRNQESNNPILTELMQCDLHLSECYKAQQVEYKQLTNDKETNPSFLSCIGFRALAGKSIKEINYN